MDISAVQTIAPAGHEQVGGHRPRSPVAVASRDVVREHAASRSMQRYEPGLAELGTADPQHRRLQIDVLNFEIARLAQTQARDTEQSEQTMIGPGSQLIAFIAAGHVQSGAQQASNFLVRVQVRTRALRPERQQAWGRNLGARIGGTAMTRKSPYYAQALRPVSRLDVCRLLRPGKRQRLGDGGGVVPFHEGHEIDQRLARLPQLESQCAPQAQVVLSGLPKRVHRTPPGHGKASVRKASISTLV